MNRIFVKAATIISVSAPHAAKAQQYATDTQGDLSRTCNFNITTHFVTITINSGGAYQAYVDTIASIGNDVNMHVDSICSKYYNATQNLTPDQMQRVLNDISLMNQDGDTFAQDMVGGQFQEGIAEIKIQDRMAKEIDDELGWQGVVSAYVNKLATSFYTMVISADGATPEIPAKALQELATQAGEKGVDKLMEQESAPPNPALFQIIQQLNGR